MSLQTDLQTAVTRAAADSALLHQIIHGDAATTVATEGGPVNSVAKAIADGVGSLQAAVDAADADAAATVTDRSAVAADKAMVMAGAAQVTADKDTVAADKAVVAGDRTAVEANAAQVAADKAAVAGDKVAAAGSASAALLAQVAAEAARDATLAAYDSFDDRYLGAKASDPTLDNDGNALVAGALYYFQDSVTPADSHMKIFTGAAWVAAYVSGSGYLTAVGNLADLNDPVAAQGNLGLGALATLSAVTTAYITDGQVTYPKIQNVSASGRILGRKSSGAGSIEELTFSEMLDLIGGAVSGDILYRGTGNWIRLPKGADGQVLSLSSGLPSWVSLSGIPSGAIITFAGSSAPSGWQLCYGQAVSRATYAALFAAIGTTYGAGNGSTTFNLPDLRGRSPFGLDNMGGAAASRITSGGSGINGSTLGAAGGAQTHTLTTAELANHSHSYTQPGSAGAGLGGYDGQFSLPPSGSSTGSAGSGSAHNNMPPALIVNFIIKE